MTMPTAHPLREIFDLTDPKWKGQVAAAGSTNGGMQAQVAAMRQLLGDEETEAWLNGLIANEVTFFGGHTDVRKAVGAGEFLRRLTENPEGFGKMLGLARGNAYAAGLDG